MMSRNPLRRARRLWLPVTCAAALGCQVGAHDEPRPLEPSTLLLRLPAKFGELTRPASRFNHGQHAEALAEQGCEACHPVDREKKLDFTFVDLSATSDRDDAMDAFHEKCLTCHQARGRKREETGPTACGECHVRQGSTRSLRVALHFDYSLHARHSAALEDACEGCHHVRDDETGKLVYREGTEAACRSCHLKDDAEDMRSLERAVHGECVGCHVQRSGEGKPAGPAACVGCHDAGRIAAIAQLPEVPRLDAGQADRIWVHPGAGQTQMVPFDHLRHEPTGRSCSTCHHQTLLPCADCHPTSGSERGGGVTLEMAHHLRTSRHSCVGCHAEETRRPQCAGCHTAATPPPGEVSCPICHSGPQGTPEALMTAVPKESASVAVELPQFSEDFPETIIIDSLSDDYEPTEFPHGRIVAALDRISRESRLASRFHGGPDVLCAGCHHHAPVGTRPAECASCHGDSAHATLDQPDLKVAYHRQCLGCHQQMKIEAVGCTDCHADRAQEAAK